MIGGTSGSDGTSALVLDAAGNVWITGVAGSTDFPVTADAFDATFNGVADAFVSELGADGSSLLYSTFLGATQSDGGSGSSGGSKRRSCTFTATTTARVTANVQ
jgi:hypothetical protein